MIRDPWTFVSGRAAVLEGELCTGALFARLLDARGPEGIFGALGETRLKGIFGAAEDLAKYDERIADQLLRRIEQMREISPDPRVAELFLIRYDFLSLKAFLKERLAGLKPVPAREGTGGRSFCVHPEGGWEGVWVMKEEGRGPFTEAVGKLHEILKRDESAAPAIPAAQAIDLVLDGAYLGDLLARAEAIGSDLVLDHVGRRVRADAIQVIWRHKALGRPMERLFFNGRLRGEEYADFVKLDPGEYRRLLAAEYPPAAVEAIWAGADPLGRFGAAVGAYLTGLLDEAKGVVFGPEKLYRYLWGLEAEAENLRLLVGGRLNGIEGSELRPRMRGTFA